MKIKVVGFFITGLKTDKSFQIYIRGCKRDVLWVVNNGQNINNVVQKEQRGNIGQRFGFLKKKFYLL